MTAIVRSWRSKPLRKTQAIISLRTWHPKGVRKTHLVPQGLRVSACGLWINQAGPDAPGFSPDMPLPSQEELTEMIQSGVYCKVCLRRAISRKGPALGLVARPNS